VFLCAACVLPALIAYNLPPSPTLLNQAVALALWGGFVAFGRWPPAGKPLTAAWPLAAALLLAACGSLQSIGADTLPRSLGLSAIALLVASWLTAWVGAATPHHTEPPQILTAFFVAWVAAGVVCSSIGVAQVFLPAWLDGDVIARSGIPGRAVGNLRQPNHLSSLLLWAAVAVVPLSTAGLLKRPAVTALFAFIAFGTMLTGSRTGMVGVLVLAAWGMLDKRLARPERRLLLSGPLWFGLGWAFMWQWAQTTGNTFGAAAHVLGAEISSSRFAIWSNTLELIARHPWAGVGWGNFNFAWSLTPFPDRPVAFFDHTHNLPLQLIVELGLPLGLTIIGLLAWALWQAWRRSLKVEGADGVAVRAAFVMVLLMAIHSQLEYPLWYAYFLLPTAWAWGVCLAAGAPDTLPRAAPRFNGLRLAGIAMVLGAILSVVDYRRVVVIFSPGDDAPSLAERIADGQRSWLFAHHADYAAATTAEHPSTVMPALKRASHYLLDTRLMMAWAKAYAELGDLDRARHLAQRLREFRNPASAEFFAACDDAALQPRPFQCDPPDKLLDWRDFR
jgi:O-antigen ligase